MTKIGSDTLTNFAAVDAATPGSIHVPMVDRQAGGDGVNRDATLKVLYEALMYRRYASTEHGYTTATDAGKPMWRGVIMNDTDATHYFSHILVARIDDNTLLVAPPGTEVEIPVARLNGGNAYSISSSGPYVYWDHSANLYVAEQPYDSSPTQHEVLEIMSVGASTFIARVRQ